ncbi:transcription antitermination factor NusB [Actinomyces sp. B33]|uniref:transcription antitermination factor NusB n=1 Tax=Actinomyces sp. B33 TaxID=2942131 RepID=UPI00233FE8D4|nr:transcription antitermination factor NusB [Actinomyces sp. B33]MDC4233345.1 transcription antitermination factor NusB [Actinomyces sp. B33]
MSKQHRFTSRTKARKRAADVVFEADQRGMGRNPQVLRDLLRERKVVTAALTPLPEYSIRLIEGVADRLRSIDDLLAAHARVSGLDRIAAVDLAVMRVAVWEMLENSEDVSPVIAIDEAIAIVKSISTDTSPAFVNAVLDAVRRDIESPAWSRRSAGAEDSAEDVEGDRADTVLDADETGDLFIAERVDEDPRVGGGADPIAVEPEGVSSDEGLSVEDLDELDELLDEY